MKIITLNVWGGSLGEKLLDFFKAHTDTDVFLLQEVHHRATEKTVWRENYRADMFTDITNILPEHTGFYAPSVVGEWGLATFVRKSIKVDEEGSVFVHKHMDAMVGRDGTSIGRNVQYLKTYLDNGEPCTILNFHGLWTGKDKNDTEDRLEQSKKMIEFIKTLTGKIILGGDFNLNPETESLQMFVRELGLRNLIKEHGVTSTRTALYTKPNKFADYIFVSPEIEVKHFEVMPDEVSDHAPLLIEV